MTASKLVTGSPYVIAEVGLTHEGSLGNALSFIDIFSGLGASAIKFQMHIPEFESSIDDTFRPGTFFPQDINRFEYYRRTGFSLNEWRIIRTRCKDRGVDFGISVFSEEALEESIKLSPDFIKIGSGEALDINFIKCALEKKYPIIISTGMNFAAEKEELIALARNSEVQVCILHCSSLYPATPDYWRLNELRSAIKLSPDVLFGLSDHSGLTSPCIIAADMGALIFEIHVTISKMSFGPDVSSSHDPESFKQLIIEINRVFESKASPAVNYEDRIKDMRVLFSKSIFYKKDFPAGHLLKVEDICYMKPGIYVSSAMRHEYIGKVLCKEVLAKQPLSEKDFNI